MKITKTKKGDMMALLNVRDYSGNIEIAVFPETYKKLKSNIEINKPVILVGKVASRNGEKTFVLEDIRELKESDK
ncbi:MAG: OB-fold nucleic acid binding domain-containing protein [Cyanobium sp. MAG06]|nr:OB-fold nucleic acid binding domain-containing protein [Cyanobium sp. MAG06]